MMLFKNATVVFQGDSITDCGRSGNNAPMGNGYPYFAAHMLTAKYPELNLNFINEGISGNRTKDLVARWDTDTLAHKPDVLTILIGINDTWRKFDSNDPTTAEEYEANYRNILTRTRDALPDCKIVMLEPFLMHLGGKEAWREDLNAKILACRNLSKEFADAFIPLDGYFAAACVQQPEEVWTRDGVHPVGAGCALIAEKLMKVLTK